MTTTSTFTSSNNHLTSSMTASQQQQSPHVARTYKQATQLYLTRRVSEALELIESLIAIPNPSTLGDIQESNGLESFNGIDGTTGSNDGASEASVIPPEAPIANATRAARVKVWSLYISIVNEVASLTAEEGKNVVGSIVKWKELVKKARDGTIWNDIVDIGYAGNEAAVDADVVANIATLLLAHAANQKFTQQKLESFLSASLTPTFDVTSHMSRRKTSPSTNTNGTSTPRDLNSRLKILEIYALHVLPANEEWEYAREFINMSEVLDEERKEAFLQALQSLQDEKVWDARKEEELNKQRQQQLVEEEKKRHERETDAAATAAATTKTQESGGQNLDSGKRNELDYGVESKNPKGAPTPQGKATTNMVKSSSIAGSKSMTPHSRTPNKKGRNQPAKTLYQRVALLMVSIQHTVLQAGHGLTRSPMAAFRAVLFMIALLMALARRDVRDRLSRITESAWEKVRRTIGMGVKVSYI